MIVICTVYLMYKENVLLLFTWHLEPLHFLLFCKFFFKPYKTSSTFFKRLIHLELHFFIVDIYVIEINMLFNLEQLFSNCYYIFGIFSLLHTPSSRSISWWVNSAVLNKEDIKTVQCWGAARNLGLMAPPVGWSSLNEHSVSFSLLLSSRVISQCLWKQSGRTNTSKCSCRMEFTVSDNAASILWMNC